ncbi:glycosyltransferase [Conexibacter sp. W3-3-2]|nr:glycosyltransferase [Conexibacter sp. W3-3-2]
MEGSRPPRVALVHDFLLDARGAERVFAVLCDLYPDADLFTAVYDERGTRGRFARRRVTTSWLQRLRPTARWFRALLPLYPAAVEGLDLRGYDLVVSSSSAWAHGVIPDEGAVHVCYCHNPFRYAWNAREETLGARGPIGRAVLGTVLARWRQWDWIAAQRVDTYVANSPTTRLRIARYLGREAVVVAPPVQTARFAPGPVGDRYVVLSQLMPHKRIDLAVRAFSQMGLPLTVIGQGPDLRRLRRLAGPTVEVVGHLPDAEVARRLSAARALVVTATEEFGIAAVEAQAAGRPVIALRAGGVRDTVIEGRTGTFYDEPTVASLCAAVRRFDPLSVDPDVCVQNARRFDVEVFRAAFAATVEAAIRDARDAPVPARRPPAADRPRARGRRPGPGARRS